MRPEIWFGNCPSGGMASCIDEHLIASFSVVRGIAWPEEAEDLFSEEETLNNPGTNVVCWLPCWWLCLKR
ncbi:MAG: hypothetical protein R2864_09135 [Syntrophotaleaceae bacterium]